MDKEREMIEKWFLTYADSVYAFVYTRVEKNRQTAADVLQATFLEALENINKYQSSKGTVLTWLILLSRNHIKNALRQKEKFANFSPDSGDGELTAVIEKIADEPLPDEIIEKQETAELVQITLAGLPEKYRDVLNQFYCRQKMIKQIAEDNRQSKIVVKITLHRARNAFKKAFLKNSKSLHSPCCSERRTL
ncbi:MAG: RNA polymerase sigma factor [Phycisphaerae bacterium]|jgi:RNA polymerase sigma-70 factor (ECF subfamily)